MAETTKKQSPSSRERTLGRMRELFPDRTFTDIGAEPQEGASDLDDAIDEALEDLSTRQAAYDENNNKLRELLSSDPSAAEFVQKWVETGDPRTALVETFGDELGMSEEGRSQFKGQLDSWRERKRANDALTAEAEANWEASISALEEWGDGKGLNLEQKRDVMLRLLAIAFNGMVNKYGVEDFDLALNAINHDTDVAAARAEGQVAGRNERIAAARRTRNEAGALPPASTAGQGGRARERRPEPAGDIWDNLSRN